MIELYILEQLDAFARNGTLSKAAEELHISQPALTRSMKKLEEETGIQLFHREGRKITLNEGGKLAAQYASRILNDEKEMTRVLSQWERSQRTVTIGSCGETPLEHLMPALQLQFPNKSITTEICNNDDILIKRLKAEDMQIVILHERPEGHFIFTQRYITENLFLFVPLQHPLADKKEVSLDEISKYNLLVYRHIGFWLPLCQKYIPSDHLLIQDSMDAMDELADSSTTAMFNSDARIQDGYVSDQRIAIPISDPCMHVAYYVACLDSQKEQYTTLFNSIRAEVLRNTKK